MTHWGIREKSPENLKEYMRNSDSRWSRSQRWPFADSCVVFSLRASDSEPRVRHHSESRATDGACASRSRRGDVASESLCLSVFLSGASESRARLVGRDVVMSSSSWSFMEVLATQIAVVYDQDDDDYKSNGFAFTDIASEDNNHVHQISWWPEPRKDGRTSKHGEKKENTKKQREKRRRRRKRTETEETEKEKRKKTRETDRGSQAVAAAAADVTTLKYWSV